MAQEAFLRVFKSLDRFDFQHDFSTWLYRIVTNLSIDLLRRRRPHLSTAAAGPGEDEDVELDLPDVDGRPARRRPGAGGDGRAGAGLHRRPGTPFPGW